jgi:hypothetical protein
MVQPDIYRPASDTEKLTVLTRLLAAYPCRTPSDFRLVKPAYMQALEGVGQWALFTAERAINQNALHHPYMPSPSEMRGQIDRAMEPFRERERRAQAEARRYAWPERLGVAQDEATRARIREGFRQLRANYPAPPGPRPPPRPPPDFSQEPVEISDALRRTLKKQ